MRYTTIIDITELPELWRNANASRVYMYMTLRSGYHDDDRDMLRVSLRRLAMETGCSVAATRHALHVLIKAGLVRKVDARWFVTKFVIEQRVTPRAKTKAQQEAKELAELREEEQRKLDRKLEQERRTRCTDETFVKQVEEFLSKPPSITRTAFLRASRERYTKLTGKLIKFE